MAPTTLATFGMPLPRSVTSDSAHQFPPRTTAAKCKPALKAVSAPRRYRFGTRKLHQPSS